MKTYVVYDQPTATGMTADAVSWAERLKFVPEGFSLWAFVFPPFWLVYHRLWLAALGYVGVMAALVSATMFLPIHPLAILASELVLRVWFGFEANRLLEHKYHKRGFQPIAVVRGKSQEECETQFFRTHTSSMAA